MATLKVLSPYNPILNQPSKQRNNHKNNGWRPHQDSRNLYSSSNYAVDGKNFASQHLASFNNNTYYKKAIINNINSNYYPYNPKQLNQLRVLYNATHHQNINNNTSSTTTSSKSINSNNTNNANNHSSNYNAYYKGNKRGGYYNVNNKSFAVRAFTQDGRNTYSALYIYPKNSANLIQWSKQQTEEDDNEDADVSLLSYKVTVNGETISDECDKKREDQKEKGNTRVMSSFASPDLSCFSPSAKTIPDRSSIPLPSFLQAIGGFVTSTMTISFE